MSRFQTQSQWENETQQNGAAAFESATDNKGIQISKKGLLLGGSLLIIIFLGIIALYIFGRPIEGTWVRQMDDNSTLAGMTVEVKRDGNILEGTIISMPEGAIGFEVGQIKWFQIKKVGFGKYEFYDLIHHETTGTYSYGTTSILTVLQGGNQLTLATDGSNSRGNFQVWVKQN